MATFNVHEAETQLSKLLDQVLEGKEVVITRNGVPIAELVPSRAKGFPLGIAKNDPLVPPGDDWWKPMTDEEADDWIEGR